MAVAVTLILLDVAGGRVRGTVLGRIALVALAFNPIHLSAPSNMTPFDDALYNIVPMVLIAAGLLTAVAYALMHRARAYNVVWLVALALTCEFKVWGKLKCSLCRAGSGR